MDYNNIYAQAVKAVSVKFNFLLRTKHAQAVKGYARQGGEIKKHRNGQPVRVTIGYTASGAAVKTDYTRSKAGALLSQIYADCIKAGYSPENAYNAVMQTTRDFGDYDIADMLQIAVFELFQSGDFLKALQELDKYLYRLTQRVIVSEQELETLYALNCKRLITSAQTVPELASVFSEIDSELSGVERDILEKLGQGLSKKETARELGIDPKSVRYHLAKIGKLLNAYPIIANYLTA